MNIKNAAVAAVFILFSAFAGAEQKGDFTYSIEKNATVTITKYTGAGNAVVIPEKIENLPVTMIGNAAFIGSKNIKDVALPSGITAIDASCFQGCAGLNSITIPAKVTYIGVAAFKDCKNLVSVTFKGNSPNILGAQAFDECAPGLMFRYYKGNTGFASGKFWTKHKAIEIDQPK